MATIEEMQASITHIENNQKNAQARADAARSKGDDKYAGIWDASAARYASLIEIKKNLIASKLRLMEIQDRINESRVLKPQLTGDDEDKNKKPKRLREDYDPQDTPKTKPVPPLPPVDPPPPPPPVKTAPIDTILFDDDIVPIEIMTDLIFENIGGQELINIARSDTVNGQKIIYQPIKNLTTIQQKYNPNNIVSLQQTSDKYFEGFSIKLNEKVPNEGNGPNGNNVYIDQDTGDIVIEVVNMYEGEQVEAQISVSGTIYEADI